MWEECRRYAAAFLREARQRLGAGHYSLFDDAIGDYDTVARNLKAVSETFPFLQVPDDVKEANIKDRSRCEKAIACLKAARKAEASGLKVLAEIVNRV